ncbi:MAG: DNA gyrase modulator, partial [Pseudomonadota bacterium]
MSQGETSFRPFETVLDEKNTLEILRDAVAGADDGEVFLERRRSESLVFDDGRLRNAAYDSSEGFGLRAVLGPTAGYAHATDLSEAALRRAAQTVKLAARAGGGEMAPPPPGTNKALYERVDPVGDEPLAAKIGLLKEIDGWLRDRDSRIVQVTASLANSVQEIEILRPEGQRLADYRPLCRMNIAVIVEQNGRRESGSAGAGGRHGLGALIAEDNWRAMAEEALRVALVNLEAEDAPAGQMDVVLGAGWPGILLHEAIGHGLEGDFNRKGS